jgi:photosystem II stability/assembly factor-like uncharacterized protein
MTRPLSHGGGQTIQVAEKLSDRVLVGTIDGVATIERSSLGGTVTNHALEDPHIHAVVRKPESVPTSPWEHARGYSRSSVSLSKSRILRPIQFSYGEAAMALALSHGAQTIHAAGKLSDWLFVGTINGVVELKKSGSDWTVARRSLEGKHIHAVLQEPESGFWFAGVNKGGIFVSKNDGATWAICNEGLTETDIYSLATVEVEGKVRIFAGTEPVHLFYSDDLGAHWAEMPSIQNVPNMEKWRFPAPPHIGHLKHINFAPNDPKTIFASVEQGGLYVSHDAGESFDEIPGPIDDVHRLVISPSRPEHMYTTGGGGLSMSEDGGHTWNNMFGYESEPGGYPDQLVFKPSDPNYMLVSAGQKSPRSWREEKNAKARISRSLDAGRTWEVLTNGLPNYLSHSIEAMSLEESGSEVQVFAATTGGEVLWSSNAGESWQTIAEDLGPISKGGHYQGMNDGLLTQQQSEGRSRAARFSEILQRPNIFGRRS